MKKKPQVISNFTSAKILAQLDLTVEDKCPECGYIYPFILQGRERTPILGSHPYCKGSWRDHLTRRVEAQIHFQNYQLGTNSQGIRTVVFIDSKGEVSIPPNPDCPTPPGMTRRELTSLKDAQDFSKEQQIKAKQEYEIYHQLESGRWNKYYAQQGRELREGAIVPYKNDETGEIFYRRAQPLDQMPEFIKDMAREAEKEFGQYQGYDHNRVFQTGLQALDYDHETLRRMQE